jgi:hypothetical protein
MKLERRRKLVYGRLVAGMEHEWCYFLTLTDGRDLDLSLRSHAWHTISTRARKIYPAFEAASVYEWSLLRGAHLHIVIKGAPGVDQAWVEHVLRSSSSGAELGDFQEVYDARGLAGYLTKQLVDRGVTGTWPKHFHPAAFSRNWTRRWTYGVKSRPAIIPEFSRAFRLREPA